MGIKTAAIISFTLVLVGLFKLYQFLSLPPYEKVILINRQHDIKIYRDKFGIPHIQAQTYSDALFAQGFVQAQDRLWQVHIRKMASYGRLSEIFGERTLRIDQYFRSVDYVDSARRITDKLSEETRNLLQSFVDGINQGRQTLTLLPIEFQLTNCNFIEWEVQDVVVFIKFMSLTMMHDFHYEMMRSSIQNYDLQTIMRLTGIGPKNLHDTESTTITDSELKDFTKLYSESFNEINSTEQILGADLMESFEFLVNNVIPIDGGSNAWAIHGNFTTTGHPFLASDPHLENGLPSQWYQSSTTFQNGDYIAGGSIVGLPYILSGRTKSFAWGITILYSDSSDLYEEQVKDINGKLHYLFKNNWYPTKEKIEVIKYGEKIYNMTIHRTNHGPILNFYFDDRGTKSIRKPDKHYALRSVVDIDDMNVADAFIKFIQGTDLVKSLQHLKQIHYPHLGMVFASQNDIAYMPVGKLIIRSGNPEQFGFIKQGWTGECEWQGFINNEEHPLIINPPKGYVATANNRFFPKNEKYHVAWNINPTGRAHRIYQYLNDNIKNNISLEKMKELQLDTVDSYAKQGWPHFRKLIKNQFFIQKINEWDFNLSVNSTQATLYMLFDYYYAQTFADLPLRWRQTYNFDSYFFLEITRFNENGEWCKNFSCLELLNQAVDKAVNHFETLPQKEWGRHHKKVQGHFTFKEKLFGIFDREIPFGGNRRTVSVSTIDMAQFPFKGIGGANYRMLVSMAPGEVGQFIVDGGVSGNPLSEHYDDQLPLYAQGRYIAMNQKSFQTLTFLKKRTEITEEDL